MNCLFEGLSQQVLAALWGGNVAIRAENNIISRQRVGSHKEPEITLNQTTFIVRQPVRVLPGRDVPGHIDLLRHPVVGTPRQILLPGPLIFKGHQLVDIGASIDDPLIFHPNSAGRRRLLAGHKAWGGRGPRC